MNTELIKQYIDLYKDNFPEVSKKELYKWMSVKHFQDHWNIEASDFSRMLAESLSKTSNLLAAGNYFPRRMLLQFAESKPEEVRNLFKVLYNNETDLEWRFREFGLGCERLLRELFKPDDSHYQDDRAIMVYMTLRFPQDYYLYKYGMFRNFSVLMNEPKPKRGDFDNVLKFQILCDALKEELLKDNLILNLHHKRLSDAGKYFQDPTYTLLTQDFIYACVNYFEPIEVIPEQRLKVVVDQAKVDDFVVKQSEPNLKGRFTNYELQQRKNSAIGISGEKFVLEYERKKMEVNGVENISKKLEHTSITKGDGLGYDLKSIDENGNTVYIEVKTTTGNWKNPFYLTRNELICSQKEAKKYRLYRLYDFDASKRTGKIKIISGDLSKLCVQPVNYQVQLTEKKN